MPAPKGHPPYPGCEKGAAYGHLRNPEDVWEDVELEDLGKEIVDYMSRKDTIWYSGFLAKKGITHSTWGKIKKRHWDVLQHYVEIADALQEEKLVTLPFFKKADSNHARLVLRKSHQDEWEKVLNAHAKSEQQQIGQITVNGLVEAARGINFQASGTNQFSQSDLASNQFILDKRQERKEDFI